MNKEGMLKKVAEATQKILGDGCSVGHQKVVKNNGVELHAVTVGENGSGMKMCIYIDEDFDPLEKGAIGVDAAAEKVVRVFKGSSFKPIEGIADRLNREYILKNVFCCLVNKEKNAARLQETVNKKHLDLSVAYYVRVGDGMDFLVNYGHLKNFGISLGQLFMAAERNTWEKGFVVESLSQILDIDPTFRNIVNLYCVSNKKRFLGTRY